MRPASLAVFNLISSSNVNFEEVTSISTLESWQQQMAYCNGGGGGDYPWPPGGEDEEGDGPSAASAVIFSFLACFAMLGAYMHFKNKKKEAALGRYTTVGESGSSEDEGLELRSTAVV